jgi:hypothetical protein
MGKAVITFKQETELTEAGSLRDYWSSEIDGVFVKNSLSYEKEDARRFYDALIKNGGVVKKIKILERTEINDKR